MRSVLGCTFVRKAYRRCRVTEADVRLYPTLIRYDSVYATLFKCSKRRIADYPGLQAWLRRMYNLRVNNGDGMQARILIHGCFGLPVARHAA